jgi:hypothetical protein
MYDSSADKMKPPRHPACQRMGREQKDRLTFAFSIRNGPTDRASRRKEEQVDVGIRLGYDGEITIELGV